ncbi:MAG: metallophosphoesterase, partial [Bacilli bacterium]|nr:metallophosphoesterase [Bacilli bacterium]
YMHMCWKQKNKIQKPISEKIAVEKYNEELNLLKELYLKKMFQLRHWKVYYKQICNISNLTEYVKKRNLPYFVQFRIEQLQKIEFRLEELKKDKNSFINKLMRGNEFQLPQKLPIFTVLGNHELADFPTVKEAVDNFKEFFQKERIYFLHNSGYGIQNFNIIGGIGFAKFNEQYNATNLLTTLPPMSREEEVKESEKFCSFYKYVVTESKEKLQHLIVLSHYPLKDWLDEEYTSICTYFTGHSHHNDSIHSERVNVYADNQIGYKRKSIQFKSCYLGAIYNPFIDFEDGYHEITTKQYIHFLNYCGDRIQGTRLVDIQLSNAGAKFYMVKQSGFYGFFVINNKTGTKICAGGRIKNISPIKDIRYFYECFKSVLLQYVNMLLPYRKVQEQISLEIKQLGFSGEIHGCIVDIDFFHHIMLNPIDGKVTLYYSPFFGSVQSYESFYALLSHIEKESIEDGGMDRLKIFQEMKDKKCLIVQSLDSIQKHVEEMVQIDIKNSVYSLSNRINQLQRIFTSNILRDWNDEWAQSCLERTSPFIKKSSFPIKIKSDVESDLELAKRFDELVKISEQEKNFVIWETKKQITQSMMYAICRKFINTHMELIKEFKTVNYGYSVSKTFEYVNVECAPLEIFEIYKQLLSNKAQYGKPICFRFEIAKRGIEKIVDISVNFIGSNDILLYQGKYIYQNKQLLNG